MPVMPQNVVDKLVQFRTQTVPNRQENIADDNFPLPDSLATNMLPNPPTSVHARQRQHRRQNSTPSALEGVNISPLPNANNRRQAAAHRRGLSLDIRRQQTTKHAARQDFNKVRLTTNSTGLATTSQQHHVLREAQPQRTQARPGPNHMQYTSMVSNSNENFMISPHGTPQTQRFSSPSCFESSAVHFPYQTQLDLMMQKNHENYYNNMAESRNFDLYSNDSALSTPTFVNFPDSPAGQVWSADDAGSRRSSRRISDGIMERVNKFESMGMEETQRPTTPPNQNGTNYYPPTPMETPQKQEVRPDRFSDDYDESMEETIKPNRNNRLGLGAQSVFAEMRQQAEQSVNVPSPPSTSKIPDAKSFSSLQMQNPDYMNMNALRNEFVKIEDHSDAAILDMDTTSSLSDHSQHASPDTQDHGQFVGAALGGGLDLQQVPGPDSAMQSTKASPHRRTESVASIASAASIADINIDETRTDTGVTLEEISQYIHSPETTDGKWMCLFEGCGKKFGRKENIKSHVQTHLNDRQYQCPTCKKCFVRQHDLKRHAKIHTGIKPYPCECGNSFARHDALTRHRQRGMCIGAFDGVVRKVVKRGRPRKNRPDMETRMEKSARTRKKNMSISSMSSFSGYSDSSAINSPDNEYHMLDDMVDMDLVNVRTHGMPSMSTAPMPTLIPRGVSGMNNDMAPSPSVVGAHSYVSPEAIMDKAPSLPASPAKSGVSHYNTPPELSQSSSPPPGHFFDMGPNTSSGAELAVMQSAHGMMGASEMNGTLPMGMSEQDDDLLLPFGQDDGGLVQLDRESSMLMLSKFDEDFEAAVSMFTNNDDMFFGNS
ncbi:C2H2 transcription factor Swi5 [Metarhizium album ARSEF 1941]|uniref:pH-response transcription factor pacC/RIM101 n=1 Tax=Metarhizium album (strain ARSEF 1941) TaxID=1081103 RepID=A0A0B2X5J3_METAS|nr:C2H2 transcription factor Swi5 [Metarhizium album ARSEF 1941]KHO01033.1 C2H2 transcription factor Swi5 [Metarhizium album ARSEF 1941]